MMRNKKACNTYALSIVAFILSVIAVLLTVGVACVEFSKTNELKFDYMGVIVGILSLLVTVLIGWNIFYALDFKKDILSKLEEKEKHWKNQLIEHTELNQKEIGNIEEKQKRLEVHCKQFEQNAIRQINRINSDLEDYISKLLQERYEIFASIHEEFAQISINEFTRNPNRTNVYATVKHFIFSIVCYQYISNYEKADELIEFLIKNIPQKTYSTINNKDKEKIVETVITIANRNDLRMYDALKSYVLGNNINLT